MRKVDSAFAHRLDHSVRPVPGQRFDDRLAGRPLMNQSEFVAAAGRVAEQSVAAETQLVPVQRHGYDVSRQIDEGRRWADGQVGQPEPGARTAHDLRQQREELLVGEVLPAEDVALAVSAALGRRQMAGGDIVDVHNVRPTPV